MYFGSVFNTIVIGVASLPLFISLAFSSDTPQPPCGGAPTPFYADAGMEPNVEVWSGSRLIAWKPPACLGWSGGAGDVVVALAGTIPRTSGADELLRRFGEISALAGVRYWSVTDKAWRVLISDATPQEDASGHSRRGDFQPAELKSGQNLFFAQRDTRSTNEVIYRIRVREFDNDHMILEQENVSPVRTYLVTVFQPGGLKFLYFLDRRPGANWNLYALLSAKGLFVDGHESSFINRAAAFYRHFVGVPPDGAPPLAP